MERRGLIRVVWEGGHIAVGAILSEFEQDYIIANPQLRNQIDWKWIIGTTIGVATLAVATLGLFVACSAVYTK